MKKTTIVKVDRVRVRGKVALAISVQRADGSGFSTTLTAADAVKLADALNDALDDPTDEETECVFQLEYADDSATIRRLGHMNRRYAITAKRADGSTLTKSGQPDFVVQGYVERLLALGDDAPVQITITAEQPGVAYCDNSPILPLDEAMEWRQPDDGITQILR